MNTVMYRVHCVSVFRPSSSFCILPMVGTTPPTSWKMIEAEMYGMMPRAKTVARDSPPPSMSYSPKNPAAAEFRMKSERAWTLTPGAAMCAPIR